MELNGKVAIITGGASGIGLAMAKRFIKEGAIVVISDINEQALAEKAAEIGAKGIPANVAQEEQIKVLAEQTVAAFGRIDIFVSNAGIAKFGDVFAAESAWDLSWHINVMAHVYAAKYALPYMIEKGTGYLLNVASAAGLLLEFHSAQYSTSKHAAIGLAEWLSTAYKEKGITVSVLCPGPVNTPMAAGVAAMQEDALEPEAVVDMVIKAMQREQFMINTHEKIWKLYEQKGQDYEKYMDLMHQRRAYKLGLDQH